MCSVCLDQRLEFGGVARGEEHLVPGLRPQRPDGAAEAARSNNADFKRRAGPRERIQWREREHGRKLQDSAASDQHAAPHLLSNDYTDAATRQVTAALCC